MKPIDVIEVRIWDRLVGALAFDPQAGAYAFEYAPEWTRGGVELAPLMMPIGARRPRFVFPALDRDAFHGLPGLIADALPDDFGNQLIDAWMAQRGIERSAVSVLDRLAYMGRRGMGALEFRPARGSHIESAAPLQMQQLVEEARRSIHADLTDPDDTQTALANIIRVGTSAGGARAKAVVAWNPDTQELRSGQFDVAPGFEHWLLKFDGVGRDLELGASADYGRIEYAYYRMAIAAGIEMSDSRLFEENGRAHFMTRRFDRNGNDKLHLQSLCALQHMNYRQRLTHAYESLFLTIHKLGLDSAVMTQAFLRMAFNVVGKNHDDHTKNVAFLLPRNGAWQLAPAYDVTYAYNPNGEWTAKHLMSVNGKFDDIGRADLIAVADRFSIPGARAAIEAINTAIADWSEHADAAGVPVDTRNRLAKDHCHI
ncbi:MAG: type II toxin-antitoxin system HipA family toxin [Lysobacteraceae bacterium]